MADKTNNTPAQKIFGFDAKKAKIFVGLVGALEVANLTHIISKPPPQVVPMTAGVYDAVVDTGKVAPGALEAASRQTPSPAATNESQDNGAIGAITNVAGAGADTVTSPIRDGIGRMENAIAQIPVFVRGPDPAPVIDITKEANQKYKNLLQTWAAYQDGDKSQLAAFRQGLQDLSVSMGDRIMHPGKDNDSTNITGRLAVQGMKEAAAGNSELLSELRAFDPKAADVKIRITLPGQDSQTVSFDELMARGAPQMNLPSLPQGTQQQVMANSDVFKNSPSVVPPVQSVLTKGPTRNL